MLSSQKLFFSLAIVTTLVLSQNFCVAQVKKATENSNVTRKIDEGSVKIYLLNFLDANSASEILHPLSRAAFSRIFVCRPLTNKNGLLIFGTKKDHERISEVIKSIDFKAQMGVEQNLEIGTLQHADARTVGDILSAIFPKSGKLTIRHNPRLGQIYLFGDARSTTVAKKLVQQLDMAARENAMKNKQEKKSKNEILMSVSFVVDAAKVNADQIKLLSPLTDAIARPLQRASQKGLLSMQKPLVAAQFVSRIRAADPMATGSKNGSFSNSSTSSNKQDFGISGTGQVVLNDEGTYIVKSEIQMAVKFKSDSGSNLEKSEIRSDIAVPLDHPVILSMSSVGGVKTAVIIRLVSVD